VDRKNDRLLQGAIALLVVVLVLVVAGTLSVRIVSAGDTAPKFSVKTDSGKTISRSDFGGKLLVLNFWATWCPPCIEELPSLNQFARTFGPQGVVVLGISVDSNEKVYRQFLERRPVAFETFRDPGGEISGDYGTFVYPETYLIDRSGKVLEKVISNQNWMDPIFLARLKQML
jgi:cytochrome c biogenesis protein CcmG/thiol:disulfide interchange protein DsbE